MDHVEQCHLEIRRQGSMWRGASWVIDALATGPRGRYAVVTSAPIRGAGDVTRNPRVTQELNDLTRRLTADGWEVVPGVTRSVFMGRVVLPTFQRRMTEGL